MTGFPGRTRQGIRAGRGFTLIELIVVIAILGILASFAVPRLGGISPKYRLRSAARLVGGQIGEARSMAGGTNEEYVIRYDMPERKFWRILPPGPEDDPELDIDDRERLEKQELPDHIEFDRVVFPDGTVIEDDVADVVFDIFGNEGSHIVTLRNEEETKISIQFSAILGVVDYFPGEKEFEEY